MSLPIGLGGWQLVWSITRWGNTTKWLIFPVLLLSDLVVSLQHMLWVCILSTGCRLAANHQLRPASVSADTCSGHCGHCGYAGPRNVSKVGGDETHAMAGHTESTENGRRSWWIWDQFKWLRSVHSGPVLHLTLCNVHNKCSDGRKLLRNTQRSSLVSTDCWRRIVWITKIQFAFVLVCALCLLHEFIMQCPFRNNVDSLPSLQKNRKLNWRKLSIMRVLSYVPK